MVEGYNRSQRNTARWLLYDWLYHMSMKEQFRIQDEDGALIIRKLKQLPTNRATVRVEQPGVPSHLEPYLKQLIGLEEKEVRGRIGVLYADGKVTEDEADLLFAQWKRVMS